MAVKNGSQVPPQTYLVPTDLSERAAEAYRVAVALAHEGSRLVVLHVVETAHIASEGHEQALIERLRELAPPVAGVEIEYRLAEGEPAEEILRAAAAADCDVIVISSHGRTGFERLLMGSVAEKVARTAECGVVMVRAHRRKSPK